MWDCALGALEASALMAPSPRKEERNKEKDTSTVATSNSKLLSLMTDNGSQKGTTTRLPINFTE